MTDLALLVGSSAGHGPSDAAKDRRALAWLDEFPPEVREEWFHRCWAIRFADRLVEATLTTLRDPGECAWCADCAAAVSSAVMTEVLSRTAPVPLHRFRFDVDAYVRALGAHRHPIVYTLADHDRILTELGGGAFRVLPFLDHEQWKVVSSFGALDQFWNNVRDLAEDIARGICYFPRSALPGDLTEDLARGICYGRAQVLRGAAVGTPAWVRLMRFWLDEYAPQVRARARPFIAATGMHPCWERFRAERLAEYSRIERVFREVGFDYRVFAERYWTEE